MRPFAALRAALCAVSILAAAAPARAADRFVDTPTVGLALPTTSLTGNADATATVQNPANLGFLGSWHLAGAVNGMEEARAEGAGSGVGVYAALPLELPLLPRQAFGVAVEQLLPPRLALAPDPGRPLRTSLAWALELSPTFTFGATWHHFSDDNGGVLDDVDTFDLGLAWHVGSHLGLGLVVRDATTPIVAGLAVQRRYQGEVTVRPLGSGRLEVGLFATLGERRGDFDPGARLSWTIIDGLTLQGEIAAESRDRLIDPAFDAGGSERDLGLRASFGLTVSFGRLDLTGYATYARGVDGEGAVAGGGGLVRWSGERRAPLIGQGDYLARVELEGALGGEKLTRVLLGMLRLARDPACRAVLIQIDDLNAGTATLQELRAAIARLRAAGKPVVALIGGATLRDYYVAAAADRVLLDAGGGIRLIGLAGTSMYFKRLFDMLGIQAQFEKYEEFKSAPEAYTREGPTPEAELVKNAIFDDLYGQFTSDLARDRKKSVDELKRLIDDGPYTAAEAGAAGLVDQVVEPEALDAAVAAAIGGRLYPLGAPATERDDRWARPKIAVIYLDGDIVDGKSRNIPLLGQKLVGGDTIAEAIAEARNDPEIEAVVLRIDSPGGSALASELMAREVKLTRKVKPVIVSMGDVAASGGYFAAAYGQLIYALPATITGSIGIFTGKVDISGLLGTIGLTTSTITRGAHADMESIYRPYTDEERVRLKQKLRYYYERFLKACAEGRGRTMEEIDAVGRGRVWTGVQAKAVGLVDREGGLIEALAEAKRRAGFGEDDRVEIVTLPAPSRDVLSQVLRLAGGSDAAELDLAQLPGLDVLRQLPLSVLLAPSGTALARLPFTIGWDE